MYRLPPCQRVSASQHAAVNPASKMTHRSSHRRLIGGVENRDRDRGQPAFLWHVRWRSREQQRSIGAAGADQVKRALLVIWRFVIGDDWASAAGVVVVAAGAMTAALQSAGFDGWWLIPVAVVLLLIWSATRHRHG